MTDARTWLVHTRLQGSRLGLYALERRPHPTWPHIWAPWPDSGLPIHVDQTRAAIHQAWELSARHRVEIACSSGCGCGRIGAILAALACYGGLEPEAAIQWVREHYDSHAVETPWQRRWAKTSPTSSKPL